MKKWQLFLYPDGSISLPSSTDSQKYWEKHGGKIITASEMEENSIVVPKELLEEFSYDNVDSDNSGHLHCYFCKCCLDNHYFLKNHPRYNKGKATRCDDGHEATCPTFRLRKLLEKST